MDLSRAFSGFRGCARILANAGVSMGLVLLWPTLSVSLPPVHIARDGSRMVLVSAGVFLMGPLPGRKIHLDTFYIDEREITQAQFRVFVLDRGGRPPGDESLRAKPYRWSARRYPKGLGDHPVVGVTWEEARRYCRWAVKRLPTEPEWEKAARSAAGRTYPWGRRWEAARLNGAELWAGRAILSPKDYDRFYWWVYKKRWEGRVVQTKPVGSFGNGASPYGVLDMAGNAAEWVADWFDENYPLSGPSENPPGPASGKEKVVRGGGYADSRWRVTTTFRDKAEPQRRLPTVGFRCARSP
ncbi:MAG: SUMF1/EgtB/PvdO family nonheme iron enzyme [Nitrospinota bacterium]|jgi:formylglycine-generating enzyme required for sulfatase activity|nr:SUMF1/EgtB/PvdO family nonheme iron enzyme [Nitrospinota bacterium]